MAEVKTNIAPASWQVTATSIECDMVKEYATIMVYNDWSCKCVWWNKNKNADEKKQSKFSKEIKAKIASCQGPECHYVKEYRDKLIQEEKADKK